MLQKLVRTTIGILLFLEVSGSNSGTRNNTGVIVDNNNNKNCHLNGTNINSTCGEKKSRDHVLNDQKTLAFYYLTMIFTIIAYALVLPPVYRKKQPSSVFIFSLAIADAFIAFVVVPIKISEVYGSKWQKNIVFCRLVNAITLFGIAIASTNIVVVSIDRALYFAFPLKYRSIVTNKRAIIASIVAFVLGLPALLPAIGVGGLTTDKELPFCAFKYSLSRAFMWFIGIVYFFVPATIITFLQLDIIRRTKKYYQQHRDFILKNPQSKQSEEQMKLSMNREMRIQRMFILIIAMFFICWGPFVVGIICNLVATHLITPFFIKLMRIMLFINSFVNPTVILIFTTNFRNLCCSRCLRDKQGNVSAITATELSSAVTNKGYTVETSFLAT